MFTIYREEILWGGRKLILETGKMARQADGAVQVSYGETVVLATVCAQRDANPDADFFPLTVNYQEKLFASGKIPGGFLKREGRPSEREILVSRLIDRPIRPLFHPDFRNETQVIASVLSFDKACDPDIVSIIASSAALTLSGIPFMGPVGAAKVGYKNGDYILNPSTEDLVTSQLDLVVAGTAEGVLMVESEASELSEDVMLGAVEFGHKNFQSVLEAIVRLAEKAAKEPWKIAEPSPKLQVVEDFLKAEYAGKFQEAYAIADKQKRSELLSTLRAEAVEKLSALEAPEILIQKQLKKIESDSVRHAVLVKGARIDGRDTKTIRPIVTEVGVLPKVHGSALFTRGETQALVTATLGTGKDEQFVDGLEETQKQSFLLHYNFPPFSVGEVGRLGSTSRREVGHGKLAWRALRSVLPDSGDFPYTVRLVSDVLESNGSSSMATVCGGALALMDAGVPIKAPVAGIAMGLIQEDAQFVVLSDILGDEDYLGDMDFKVAGTAQGVTALQMDLKVTSITPEIMRLALSQAQEGRLHILSEMAKSLPETRGDLNPYAPRISKVPVPQDKIGELIGPGGSRIRGICESTGATIDINDREGYALVGAPNQDVMEKAVAMVKGIVSEPEIGKIYEGRVVSIKEFGAFVNFMGNRDGLLHVSELSHKRVSNVEDVLKVNDMVRVKCIGIDARGKVKLSMKALDSGTKDLSHKTQVQDDTKTDAPLTL